MELGVAEALGPGASSQKEFHRRFFEEWSEQCSSLRGTLTVPREDSEHDKLHLPCIAPLRCREHSQEIASLPGHISSQLQSIPPNILDEI